MDKIDFKKTMKDLVSCHQQGGARQAGRGDFPGCGWAGRSRRRSVSKGDSRPLPGRLHREILSEKGGDDRLCRPPSGGALVR